MEKIENFDNDAAFFNIVNMHKNQIDIDAAAKAKLENLYPFVERGVEKSIQAAECEIIYERQVARNKKNNKKLIAALLAAITILTSSISIAGRLGIEHLKIDVASDLGIEEMEKKLLAGDLAYLREIVIGDGIKTYEFVIKDNSPTDYSRISINDISDIYHMKNTLPSDEFKDFIKSQTYIDKDTGEIHYYENFTHFLYVNGFRNESEFNKTAEDAILVQYENENIRINYNNIDTDYVPTGRGGK